MESMNLEKMAREYSRWYDGLYDRSHRCTLWSIAVEKLRRLYEMGIVTR